ncbi:MAG: hypothetical protein K0U74_14575 [Alphaproteobacteria bacterium]|nr:hypothetical protein [Alphaproteobacteria bacterium]
MNSDINLDRVQAAFAAITAELEDAAAIAADTQGSETNAEARSAFARLDRIFANLVARRSELERMLR